MSKINISKSLNKLGKALERQAVTRPLASWVYTVCTLLDPKKAEYQLVLARSFRRRRKLQKASIAIESAHQLEPDSAMLSIERAHYFSAAKNWSDALISIEEARRSKPVNLSYVDRHAVILDNLGRTNEAIALLKDFKESMKAAPGPLFRLGKFQQKTGDISSATATFESCVQIAPDKAAYVAGLMQSLRREGRFDDSTKVGLAALERKTENAQVLVELGLSLSRLGRKEEAVDYLKKAARKSPRRAGIHHELAKIYLELKQSSASILHASRALLLDSYNKNFEETFIKSLKFTESDRKVAYFNNISKQALFELINPFYLIENLKSILYFNFVISPEKFASIAKYFQQRGSSEAAATFVEGSEIYFGKHSQFEIIKTGKIPHQTLSFINLRLQNERLREKVKKIEIISAVNVLYEEGETEAALKIVESAKMHFGMQAEFIELEVKLLLSLGRTEDGLMLISDCFSETEIASRATRSLGDEFLKEGFPELAVALFETEVRLIPSDPNAHIRLGRALVRCTRYEEALRTFNAAVQLDPGSADALHGAAAMNARLGRAEEAAELYEQTLHITPHRLYTLIELARLRKNEGKNGEALDLLNRAHSVKSSELSVFFERANIYSQMGEIKKAEAECLQGLTIKPGDEKLKIYLELIRQNSGISVTPEDVTILLLNSVDAKHLEYWTAMASRIGCPLKIITAPDSFVSSWEQLVGDIATMFALIVPAGAVANDDIVNTIIRRAGPRVGLVCLCDDKETTPSAAISSNPSLWLADPLKALTKTKEWPNWTDFVSYASSALQLRRVINSTSRTITPNPEDFTLANGSREVWLVSTSGVSLFGGVEQFLRTLVPIYRSLGFQPIIVGVIENIQAVDAAGTLDDIKFINLPRTTSEIRRAAIERRPAVVHGTTGVGYELFVALNGLSTKLIYGTHFWREMFQGSGFFGDVDKTGLPRKEFEDLIGKLDQGYANSLYTRDVIEKHFNVVQPVLYSLPFDVSAPLTHNQNEYALLLNARPDKGFDFVLSIAAMIPEIQFKAIASQVSRERAQAAIDQVGVKNVELINWTENVSSLYQNALCVLVPSFAFIETFSRVIIEAHRHGVPVIGSDRGNVPILLKDSGISLSEDPRPWAEEIQRLSDDESYWKSRSSKALTNSEHYKFEDQFQRVERLVRSVNCRVAIGVGSGIGNIIQMTPAIRRISEHFNAPVDILLREDFPGCSCIFAGAECVGTVLPADKFSSITRYDVVLLFDGFGKLLPKLNTETLLVSSHHLDFFNTTKTMHEAEFYLHAAQKLLNIEYGRTDCKKYFLGDIKSPKENRIPKRIGLHAGSKSGAYAAKQWPYFEELAELLIGEGYELVSFGANSEAVVGTVDLTGTSLKETFQNIAKCSYFVSNDSGLMHVADALRVPLTSIFAPSSIAKNGPLSEESKVVGLKKSCAPCQFDLKKMEKCNCISEIAVTEVYNTVRRELERLRI